MRRRKHSKRRQLEYEKKRSLKKSKNLVISYDVVELRDATREFQKVLSSLVIGSAKAISDAIEERESKLESFSLDDGGKSVLILNGYYSGSYGIVCALSESMKYATIKIPTKIRTLFAYNMRKSDVQFMEMQNAPQV